MSTKPWVCCPKPTSGGVGRTLLSAGARGLVVFETWVSRVCFSIAHMFEDGRSHRCGLLLGFAQWWLAEMVQVPDLERRETRGARLIANVFLTLFLQFGDNRYEVPGI